MIEQLGEIQLIDRKVQPQSYLTLYRQVCFAPSQRGAASQGGGRMMGGDDDDGDAIAETQETSSENLFQVRYTKCLLFSQTNFVRHLALC